MGKKRSQAVSRAVLAAFFMAAGINHFLHPAPYLAMMPPWLPAAERLNAIAGAAEMLGAAGVLLTSVRKAAAWGLIALLVAVFPANLQAALHGWPGVTIPAWVLWLRLPFQPLMIWWVYRSCLRGDL